MPLNADSRGPLLHAVIEHSDVEAIVVRDELVERLTTLTDLAHLRLVSSSATGPCPTRSTASASCASPTGSRACRRDHTWPLPRDDEHAAIMYTSGTHGPAEGRRLHAPVPLSLRVARV